MEFVMIDQSSVISVIKSDQVSSARFSPTKTKFPAIHEHEDSHISADEVDFLIQSCIYIIRTTIKTCERRTWAYKQVYHGEKYKIEGGIVFELPAKWGQ